MHRTIQFFFIGCLTFFPLISESLEIDDRDLLVKLIKSVSHGVNFRKPNEVLEAFIHPTALIVATYQGSFTGRFSPAFNTAQGLSDFVKNTEKAIKQHIDNVKVELISGGRAIVKNTYSVTIDDVESHHGLEMYSAVKTKNGWKIVSLLFTMRAPLKS